MAQITFFHYIHRDSMLHRMDGRLKLLCLLLLTASASMSWGWPSFLMLLVLLSCGLVVSKLPVIAIFKNMKALVIMLIIALMMNGFYFASRLVLMILISTIMAGTTPLLTIKNTIEWYLRPIPFVPEVRIATLIYLTFMLIPLIFDNYLEMMEAQKARCIGGRKNPIKRIKFIVFPLLTRTLRRADEIVFAMESRCYSETRTRGTFQTTRADWFIVTICVVILIFKMR